MLEMCVSILFELFLLHVNSESHNIYQAQLKCFTINAVLELPPSPSFSFALCWFPVLVLQHCTFKTSITLTAFSLNVRHNL